MLKLIDKDFKLSTKINIFLIFFLVMTSVMGVLFKSQLASKFMYIISIIMSVFICITSINEYDNKYEIEKVLNSLPIDRSNIVVSRYIILVIYIFVIWSSMSIVTNLFKITGFANGATVGINELIISFCLCILYYTIYYPFYFKLGEKTRIFNQIAWVLVFIIPAILEKTVKKLNAKGILIQIINKLANIDFRIIISSIIVILIISYYISCQISKKYYQGREF